MERRREEIFSSLVLSLRRDDEDAGALGERAGERGGEREEDLREDRCLDSLLDRVDR